MKDLYSGLTVLQKLAPLVRNTDTNSASQDLQGYHGATFVVSIGARVDTWDGSNYIELELWESDDDASFTRVADADIYNAVTGTGVGTFAKLASASAENQDYKCGYRGNKRYIRARIDFTGTHSTGVACGVSAVLKPLIIA